VTSSSRRLASPTTAANESLRRRSSMLFLLVFVLPFGDFASSTQSFPLDQRPGPFFLSLCYLSPEDICRSSGPPRPRRINRFPCACPFSRPHRVSISPPIAPNLPSRRRCPFFARFLIPLPPQTPLQAPFTGRSRAVEHPQIPPAFPPRFHSVQATEWFPFSLGLARMLSPSFSEGSESSLFFFITLVGFAGAPFFSDRTCPELNLSHKSSLTSPRPII